MIWIIRLMQVLSYLAAGLFALFIVVFFIETFSDIDIIGMTVRAEGLDAAFPGGARIVFVLMIGSLAYAFFRLGRLFGLFAKGRYFSQKGVQHMRVFASIYVGWQVVDFFGGLAGTFYERGHLHLSREVSSDGIGQFMLGMTFLIIAHVLNEARKNNEELDNYF